jgi:polar amino acid transport system substrate-binding protein
MKKFTKITAAILAGTMMLGFAACGSSNSKAGDGEKKTLTMATNAAFPPYEYYEGEKVVGIDAEIAQAIADKLGYELKIEDMDFNSIITAVQTGKVDMGMAGMTVTEDRKKNVDFTDSYATGIQSVIVKEDSTITSVDDLGKLLEDGKSFLIGVQQSTTGDIYCSAAPEDGGYGEDHVTKFTTGANAIQALVTGKVDCVIIDNEPAKKFVEANKGLKILDTEYAVEDYAIAISKDNSELMQKVNGALKDLIADGTVKKILDKYIKAD